MSKVSIHNLSTGTLEDIRRHQDKLLRLASFYSQSDFSCFTDNISKLQPGATEIERIEAMEKDINKTSDFMSKATRLLSTTNQDGIITEAKGSPNIADIFQSNFNPETNSITLGGVKLTIGTELSKEEAKDELVRSMFGISVSELIAIKKQTKKVYTITKDDVASKEDAIMYLAELPLRESHKPLLEKIDLIKEQAEQVRAKYIDKSNSNQYQSLNMIDREITGSRAMIDSITKASTHVSTNAEHQSSPRHSKDDIAMLSQVVKENPYISDVEIDPDADVLKVINLIQQIKGLKLNLHTDFTLKVRKLGNYKAAGLCVPSQNIVAVNIDRPSSLIHELTHLVDLTNDNIKGSSQREILINKFRDKLELDDVTKQGYFSSDEEIVARLGELSYLLNKFDYNGGNFNDFVKRTQELEKNDESMCVVKDISTYLASPGIYFGFGKEDVLSEQDLLEIRDYYLSYWGVDQDYIEETKVYTQEDKKKLKKSQRPIKNTGTFTPTSFSNITDASVVKSYEASKVEDVMEPDEFARDILVNMQHLYRSKKRIRGDEVVRQFKTVDNLMRHILETGDDNDKKEALVALSEHTGFYYLGTISTLTNFLENLPLDQAKELYSEMVYQNSEGIEYTLNDKKDATSYLNEYGERSARKMTSLLISDFVKQMPSSVFEDVLLRLKPNTRAFYELVISRQSLATDEQLRELKDFLKSKGWLSIFKFDRVDLIGKRMGSRYRSLTTVNDVELVPSDKAIIADAYKTLLSEFQKFRGDDKTAIGLYDLDNLEELMEDEITQQMDVHYISNTDYNGEDKKKQFVIALKSLINGAMLRELANVAEDGSKSWKINQAHPIKTKQDKVTTSKKNSNPL